MLMLECLGYTGLCREGFGWGWGVGKGFEVKVCGAWGFRSRNHSKCSGMEVSGLEGLSKCRFFVWGSQPFRVSGASCLEYCAGCLKR